jgi:hypothetical protein
MLRKIGLSVAIALLAGSVQAQTVYTKSPDLGPFWQPLSPNGGTFVYADCFIAPAGVDVWPHVLGTWLNNQSPPPPSVRFEIWGDTGGNGPDAGNVLATTGSLTPNPVGLELISAPVQIGAQALVPGTLYWFAATVVGESGTGAYQVGGHTQNSQHVDNCTFWYSNDPGGVVFDGQNLVPEMAFTLTLDDVPVPVELMEFTVGD